MWRGIVQQQEILWQRDIYLVSHSPHFHCQLHTSNSSDAPLYHTSSLEGNWMENGMAQMTWPLWLPFFSLSIHPTMSRWPRWLKCSFAMSSLVFKHQKCQAEMSRQVWSTMLLKLLSWDSFPWVSEVCSLIHFVSLLTMYPRQNTVSLARGRWDRPWSFLRLN